MTLQIESTFEILPTLKRILPNWPCLPNNLGGLLPPAPPPGMPMSGDKTNQKSLKQKIWFLSLPFYKYSLGPLISPKSLTLVLICFLQINKI